MDVPIAANVLGTFGAVCWSIQLLPQIFINYHRHSTAGLQRSMMLLWALAGIPLGVYNITQNANVALRVQPQILTVLSLLTWAQCCYYDEHWSKSRCALVLGALAVVFGGIEAGLVFALRTGISNGTKWPITLMGVLSTVLLSAGVLRHYYDIYVHHTVRGISFLFVGIDAAGDVFSLIAIFFQAKLDVLGMVIYATEFTLWCGIFACGGYFNLLPWLRQRRKQSWTNQTTEVNGNHLQRDHAQDGNNGNNDGVSNAIELERMPSSTSVFRTPSSVLSMRASVHSQP